MDKSKYDSMRNFFGLLMLGTLLMAACARQERAAYVLENRALAAGDSTIYGLACDGCNDTVVVFLHDPYDGSDPDTLNILEASKQHRVFGTLRIGDQVAIVRSREDSAKADIVIVTQDLIGQWCYKVKPTLRQRAGMDSEWSEMGRGDMADSLQALLAEEREYGFDLKLDSIVASVGYRLANPTGDEESPVEYPAAKRYQRWCIHNGRLLLTERVRVKGSEPTVLTDTAELVALSPDTLVLRLSDGLHGYYRKAGQTE